MEHTPRHLPLVPLGGVWEIRENTKNSDEFFVRRKDVFLSERSKLQWKCSNINAIHYNKINHGEAMKLLIEQESGKTYLVKDTSQDFHTSHGTITSKELQSGKKSIRSSTQKLFLCLEARFPDLWESLQRGPQVVIQKDIGLILAKTGANKDSRVVDAGGGSGSLCLSLANVCGEVTVYEVNTEYYNLLMKNVATFGLRNIKVKREDIYKGITEKELDLITLDLPEPWRVTLHAEKALKNGGFTVVYAPQISQTKQFIDSTKKTRIKVLETIELLERKWRIEDKIMRPEFAMLGHTGFLTFCRKL